MKNALGVEGGFYLYLVHLLIRTQTLWHSSLQSVSLVCLLPRLTTV